MAGQFIKCEAKRGKADCLLVVAQESSGGGAAMVNPKLRGPRVVAEAEVAQAHIRKAIQGNVSVEGVEHVWQRLERQHAALVLHAFRRLHREHT